MTVTPSNIKLGACDVTFDTLDLGGTKGGVDVSIKVESYDVKADQVGGTPLKSLITGTIVEVKVPMLETNMAKLHAVIPQSTTVGVAPALTGLEIGSGINLDLLSFAKVLKLHPTGVAAETTDQDFTAFLAVPLPNFSFKYMVGQERVYEVTFKCYPDLAHVNQRICAFGAYTAAG